MLRAFLSSTHKASYSSGWSFPATEKAERRRLGDVASKRRHFKADRLKYRVENYEKIASHRGQSRLEVETLKKI
jgi:hypothetical protein